MILSQEKSMCRGQLFQPAPYVLKSKQKSIFVRDEGRVSKIFGNSTRVVVSKKQFSTKKEKKKKKSMG